MYKDECLITYFHKTMVNPSYQMGEDSNRFADSEEIFGKELTIIIFNISMIFAIASLYTVSNRNNFAPFYVYLPFIACYFIYLLVARKFYAPRFFNTYLQKYVLTFKIAFLGTIVTYLYCLVLSKKYLKSP